MRVLASVPPQCASSLNLCLHGCRLHRQSDDEVTASTLKNDAIAAALVHNYFVKHGMNDIVRIFESEAADVR